MGLPGQVLVVDDEPQVRSALARSIRTLGLEPIVAASGEEALALAEGVALRAVVTDLHMPGMGGVALLQRLSPTQRGARFIVVTGNPDIAAESFPHGHASVVLRKPWGEEALERALTSSGNDRMSTMPPPPSRQQPAMRVLVLDDDPADAALFQTALRLNGSGVFKVTAAESLRDAEQRLDMHEIDVAAVDLSLPDSYGVRTVARLQAQAPNLALVVLSGSSDPELALHCVQAGAQDYLIKGQVGGATIAKALRYARERKNAELRLANMAFRDQLTGLANRTLFRQRVAEALARSRRSGDRFAVLLLDMDRFKSVNDAFGHDAGDAYLQQMAERLQGAVRETDTVARLGGDEFAVIAEPITEPGDAELLGRRILDALRRPLSLSGITLQPTSSIGGALFPDSGTDCDTLLAAADAAMYEVKSAGRNGFRLHGIELTRRIAERFRMETALRYAVENKQLLLHYQPQYASTGALRGAEALLRWQQDDGNLVPAEQFLSILEETGLIVGLGPWLFSAACRQLAEWRNDGYEVPHIAVNLSAKQLARPGLADEVQRAIEQAGLIPNDVELELTETALITDETLATQSLHALHELGFRLVLDDFGTGYSSLSHLQRFPISAVKIDKSFIKNLCDDPRHKRLVGGIIQLASRLGLEVVAEGVEDEAQRQMLCGEGCHLLQGYLFGRAVSGRDFTTPLKPSPNSRRCAVA